MKRNFESGCSPPPKLVLHVNETTSSQSSTSSVGVSSEDVRKFLAKQAANSSSQSSNASFSETFTDLGSTSELQMNCRWSDSDSDTLSLPPLPKDFATILEDQIEDGGIDLVAKIILNNEGLKRKLTEIIYKESFTSLKSSLKVSI